MADLISVIVTTYNREDALESVLRSLSRQTDRGFEIVVADDGSGASTRALVDTFKPRIGVPLRHVWHEDKGFRAAKIRNFGILRSSGRYCVFLDGDCIARRDFVAAHRRLAEPGWFVTGNRLLLSAQATERVLKEKLEPEIWTATDWIRRRAAGEINRLLPLMALPMGPLRKLAAGAWQGARSCNLAVWRSDLDRVDGFDAAYDSWGREDSDLIVRLLHAGIRRKLGSFATGVIHLWHPEADRSGLETNDGRLGEVMSGERVRARSGMSSLGKAMA
ncbi:MAG TPA: glycosyltransferase family 2 protein [Pseudorhodoplanes sp.]|nr:glycosyltransferase family 2 protein [Pseudorhodoplanes sp.]